MQCAVLLHAKMSFQPNPVYWYHNLSLSLSPYPPSSGTLRSRCQPMCRPPEQIHGRCFWWDLHGENGNHIICLLYIYLSRSHHIYKLYLLKSLPAFLITQIVLLINWYIFVLLNIRKAWKILQFSKSKIMTVKVLFVEPKSFF